LRIPPPLFYLQILIDVDPKQSIKRSIRLSCGAVVGLDSQSGATANVKGSSLLPDELAPVSSVERRLSSENGFKAKAGTQVS
jgi:hypothetical protein